MSDVLERSAPAGVLIDHDFVAGNDVEQRRVQPHPARNDGFHAELGMAAAARVETEIEPALARTAVRELDERRRLETAAEVAINAGARGDPEHQPGHRACPAVGLRAAVARLPW